MIVFNFYIVLYRHKLEDRRKGGRDYSDRDRKKSLGEKTSLNLCFVFKKKQQNTYTQSTVLSYEMNILNLNINWKRWLFLSDERLGKKSDSEELPDFKNRPGKFMSYGCEIVKF